MQIFSHAFKCANLKKIFYIKNKYFYFQYKKETLFRYVPVERPNHSTEIREDLQSYLFTPAEGLN